MEEQLNTTDTGTGKNKTLLYATIAVVILLALGAAYLVSTGKLSNAPIGDMGEETTGATGPVAIVNGEEIPRETFNKNFNQFKTALTQSGSTATDEQISQQTLDAMINTELLLQKAESEGISVTDADVQTEYDRLVQNAGGAEAFAAQLEQAGFSEDELRTQLAEELTINAYIESATDFESITVTDEDVATFYEELSVQNPALPALDDVREQIKEQLRIQAQQQQVAALIAELRAEAEIEVMI